VSSATEINLVRHTDERGILIPIEFEDLPFIPKRLFTVQSVPAGGVRGGHGHRICWQFLLALSGIIEVTTQTSAGSRTTRLTPGASGLIIPPRVFAEQRYVQAGGILLVLASEPYDPDDYLTAKDLCAEAGRFS
jgi:UDP-2-acetamido-3-amino-2,3-dideoxy-glucuronate N-acetyltransferase